MKGRCAATFGRAYVMGLMVLLCLWPCSVSSAFAFSERPVANVLIINSFHPGHFWEDSLQKGIFVNLTGRSDVQIRIYSEYLDYERNSSGSFNAELIGLFRKKYRNVVLSAVIAVDDDALDFVISHRRELFSRVPVVFCGVANLENRIREDREYYTGILENFSIRCILDAIAAVHPDARHLAVICGDTTSSKIALEQASADLENAGASMEVRLLRALPAQAMAQELKALPEDAVLLNFGYYRTADGQNFSMDESMQLLRSWTDLPMYSPWESQIGRGVLAGQGEFNAFHAEQASRMTLEIIRGRAPGDIPVMREPAATLIYDYPMLLHYGIDERTLPEFATVANRPPSYVVQHRDVLIPAFIVLVILCGVIVLLVHLLRMKHRSEALLRQEKDMMEKQYAFERRSQLARRMEVVGRMAGGIAHDVNNILGSIAACARLALEEIPVCSPAHEDVRQILSATDRGKDIMAQIRMTDGSQAGGEEPGAVPVTALLAEFESVMRPRLSRGTTLRVRNDARDVCIHGVRSECLRILFNLGINAVQAMPEGGEIVVHAETFEKPEGDAEPGELAEGFYVRLDVCDTGEGIAPGIRDRIFDPFFTTRSKKGGCGLGLAQVHSLVQRGRGAVRVEEKSSGGTRFSVFLPVVSA